MLVGNLEPTPERQKSLLYLHGRVSETDEQRGSWVGEKKTNGVTRPDKGRISKARLDEGKRQKEKKKEKKEKEAGFSRDLRSSSCCTNHQCKSSYLIFYDYWYILPSMPLPATIVQTGTSRFSVYIL